MGDGREAVPPFHTRRDSRDALTRHPLRNFMMRSTWCPAGVGAGAGVVMFEEATSSSEEGVYGR